MNDKLKIGQPKNADLTFYDTRENSIHISEPPEEVGRLSIKDGVMTFTGDVDESAEVMFETICTKYNNELATARRKLAAIGELVDACDEWGTNEVEADRILTILEG